MQAEAALLGTPRQLIYEGVAYPVDLIGKKAKSEFERLFSARALERLAKRKSSCTRKEYLAELRLLEAREDRGEFSFVTNAGILLTAWGQSTLMSILAPTCPKSVLERILEEQSDEVAWLINQILRESMPESTKRAEKENPQGPFEEGHLPELKESPNEQPEYQPSS